jgi:hypothetical protein
MVVEDYQSPGLFHSCWQASKNLVEASPMVVQACHPVLEPLKFRKTKILMNPKNLPQSASSLARLESLNLLSTLVPSPQ